MSLIDGVVVTKIYDSIILPIIHTTLPLRSNKSMRMKKSNLYHESIFHKLSVKPKIREKLVFEQL